MLEPNSSDIFNRGTHKGANYVSTEQTIFLKQSAVQISLILNKKFGDHMWIELNSEGQATQSNS